MQKNCLRLRLQTATRDVHQMLHRAPAFAALAEGNISRRKFNLVMSRMGGFYAALDKVMADGCRQFEAALGEYRYVPRAAFFETPVSESPDLAAPESAASLAGMAYVTDGATLGGKILGRAIGGDPVHPYFEFCSTKGSAIWRRTLALLEHVDRDGKARADAVHAALTTFEAFASHVTPEILEQAA